MSPQAFVFDRLRASQMRQPRGIVGKLVGQGMTRQTRESNDWTISLLPVQPNDHVTEVDFGPGRAVESVSQMASAGLAAGIDFSEAMVRQVGRLNDSKMDRGRVELRITVLRNFMSERNQCNMYDTPWMAFAERYYLP